MRIRLIQEQEEYSEPQSPWWSRRTVGGATTVTSSLGLRSWVSATTPFSLANCGVVFCINFSLGEMASFGDSWIVPGSLGET